MTTPFIVSPTKKFDPSNKSISNPDLFGTWQHVGSGRKFLIDQNSFYYIIDGPHPYSANATTLDLDGWVFDRLYGDGTDIIGVWIEPNTSEEVTFRTDGSYSWYDPGSTMTFGQHETTKSPDTLTTVEARAYITEAGNQLIFDTIFAGNTVYDFTVSQTDLVLTDPLSGDIIKFLRVQV